MAFYYWQNICKISKSLSSKNWPISLLTPRQFQKNEFSFNLFCNLEKIIFCSFSNIKRGIQMKCNVYECGGNINIWFYILQSLWMIFVILSAVKSSILIAVCTRKMLKCFQKMLAWDRAWNWYYMLVANVGYSFSKSRAHIYCDHLLLFVNCIRLCRQRVGKWSEISFDQFINCMLSLCTANCKGWSAP